jgi:DNA sulfur modification protein DndC
MTEPLAPKRKSFFAATGLTNTLEAEKSRLQDLYASDDTPWVIGYSGGKDSTAVVQLVWLALSDLPEERRTKPVYVITTDTLVENPIVASWVTKSLNVMGEHAALVGVPVKPHLIEPEVKQTFWVNLIGKGYPAPRPRFRWCTERLKIKPSSKFIQDVANQHGEAILLLGARKAESAVRAARLNEREKDRSDGLSPHPELINTLVLSPIQDWTNDDVWTFLMRVPNPWGHSNKDLMAMYRGATEDNECPVVVDTSTPSCGNSRFGCWVCTLVDQDKSMSAMIQNDVEKEWMLPMLELRNELDFRGDDAHARDKERRDFRRLTGRLTHYKDRDNKVSLVHGPYTQDSRRYWLTRVLSVQAQIRKNPATPEDLRDIELISIAELQEIRRMWVSDKREIEDLVPQIYKEATGESYPGAAIDENLVFDASTFAILKGLCEEDRLLYETTRNLLDVERQYRLKGARHGLFDSIESTIRSGFFVNEEDALQWHKRMKQISDEPVVDHEDVSRQMDFHDLDVADTAP